MSFINALVLGSLIAAGIGCDAASFAWMAKPKGFALIIAGSLAIASAFLFAAQLK